jgi:predicted nucleotidyltransferase
MIDPDTARAVQAFLEKIAPRYDVVGAVLYGSRARQSFRSDSDADVAVLLHGESFHRADVAIEMAGLAFDVLMETGVLVEALPLLEGEWEHPERFSNPALIENIRREGVLL